MRRSEAKGYRINNWLKIDNIKSYNEIKGNLKKNIMWIVVSVIVNSNSYSYRSSK